MRRGCGLANAKKYNYDVKTAFYTPLVCLSLSCNRVAASRMQIVTKWPPVASKPDPGRQLHANFCRFYLCCMRLEATQVQKFACDWRPLGYTLYATCGPHWHANFAVLAASCMRSRRFLASTLQKQLFELKNEDAIKKSQNLRDTCAC